MPDLPPDALDRAAALCGIQPEFWDIFGHHHVTSPETKRAIVTALGFLTGSPENLEHSIAASEAAARCCILPPTLVLSINAQPFQLPLQLPLSFNGPTATLTIHPEDAPAETHEVSLTGRQTLELPHPLPLGYHQITLALPGFPPSPLRLIVTPDRAFQPKLLENNRKTAGFAVTLYGLRSSQNWGCGDFRDLHTLCHWAAKDLGVSFIALNPLHAIHNRQPYNASPYLPNSIYYHNFLYLDIEALEGFQQSPDVQALFHSPEIQEEIRQLRATSNVEYERVQALKLRFLRLAFQWSRAHPDPWRALQFSVYIEKEGDLLLRFATFCALDAHLHHENPNLWVWTDWPEGFRHPETDATHAFQASHPDEILFYQYIQWQVSRQLAEAKEYTRDLGMPIGLYHDMALATDRCGSDLWAHRPFYVEGCRVGSPPDDFSPEGQDWAFPPPNKNHHRATGYRLFAESIRKTCRFGGALRIDHVMRFFRLFWIPDGNTATGGAYVRDNWEDLIRILALESCRNQVLIVGEDLGTVEPEVRETLARFGILSYRLLYFERGAGGEYKHSSEYPRQSLVSSTTHDLPTIAGFWVNEDIEARRRAGVLDQNGYHHQLADRAREKQKMLDVLWKENLLPPHVPRDAAHIPELTGDLHNSVIGFLAFTPSMLMVVNQEDLSKEIAQQNLPGTTHQHPNWSRKMRYSLEDLTTDPEALGFTQMFRHWLERTGRLGS